MLAVQCLKNVWRKPAFRHLITFGKENWALKAWREPIQHAVPNTLISKQTLADIVQVCCKWSLPSRVSESFREVVSGELTVASSPGSLGSCRRETS